jgi:intraflagellar transport protein 88
LRSRIRNLLELVFLFHLTLFLAATNLSFLYILEGDLKNAEKYADIAVATNRYNAKAQNNLGNCHHLKGNFDKAREYYLEAVSVDALCVEAMYNLGLAYKENSSFSDALVWFEKLHSILKSNPEVIYQIADIHAKSGNSDQAMEMFNILITVIPTDPGILARMGDIFAKEDNANQAFQAYSESYRYFPSNLQVISWLGSYYIDCEIYDQALQFYQRAAAIQPNESKWQLMIASCQRKSGNYQNALGSYTSIHGKFPENVECLRHLVRICTDLGISGVDAYTVKLGKAERGTKDYVEVSGKTKGDGVKGVEIDTTPSFAHARGTQVWCCYTELSRKRVIMCRMRRRIGMRMYRNCCLENLEIHSFPTFLIKLMNR